MKRPLRIGFVLLIAVVWLAGIAKPALADLAASFNVYVYPTRGQSAAQQGSDEAACYDSAQTRTGYTPGAPPPSVNPPPPAPKGHGLLRGGAVGAASGAAIGAVAGNAGEGAAIGAVAGGLLGARRQRMAAGQQQQAAQNQSNAAQQQLISNFQTAFSACMTARGYVAK
jgi:hypothetical protein